MNIEHVHFCYADDAVLQDVSYTFKKGCITTIIGANGSGKSTLLKLMGRILKPDSGSILLDGQDIWSMHAKTFSRAAAMVHQIHAATDIDVKTIVNYGRLPYHSYLQSCDALDWEIVQWAMEITGISDLADCSLQALSGGQQQRVWLAMALAQKTPLLLLDEPTTYLDLKYQIEILKLVQEINKIYGIMVVMVHHDMNQAMHFSDEIVAMKEGRILFSGCSADVITKEALKELYDYDLNIVEVDENKVILNY